MKILYIDGGGTKTATYLVDNKKIILEKVYGAANVNTDYQKSLEIIMSIINFYHEYGFQKIIIGLAGIFSNKKAKKNLLDILEKLNINVVLLSDVELLAKLIKEKFKLNNFSLLNLGTGTTFTNFKNNKIQTYLGWGKIIGDPGSAYDIGLNFLKFCSQCEDWSINNKYYKLFLEQENIQSIREYVPLISNYENISKISLWINNLGKAAIRKFIIPRVKLVLEYISFINSDNLFLTGSILIKNLEVRKFIGEWFKETKKINFIELKDCII